MLFLKILGQRVKAATVTSVIRTSVDYIFDCMIQNDKFSSQGYSIAIINEQEKQHTSMFERLAK